MDVKDFTTMYVYMLRCDDGTLYTGFAVDVMKRWKKHQTGKGARYTRTRLPVVLCYCEKLATKSEALRREHAIKKLSRQQKEALIQSNQNCLYDVDV